MSVDVIGTTSRAENGRGEECERPLCFRIPRRAGYVVADSSARIGIGGGGREMMAVASVAFGAVYHCRGTLPAAMAIGTWIASATSLAIAVEIPLGVSGLVLPASAFLPKNNLRAMLRVFDFGFTVVADVLESMDKLESDLVRIGMSSLPSLLCNAASVSATEVGGDEGRAHADEGVPVGGSDTALNGPGLLRDERPENWVESKFIHTSSSPSSVESNARGGSVGGSSRPLPLPEKVLEKAEGEEAWP